jgi:predicted ATPase
MSWCVITAGPSAGKSSTIRELSSRGYRTLPEAARVLFDQRISEGDDPADVREEPDFHKQVERVDRRIESNLKKDKTFFLDRSLADNIAYRRHFGSPVPDTLLNVCTKQYDYIFLLERLDFSDDEVRSEDEQEASTLHKELRWTYEDLGYDVIDVPVMNVNKRADFILEFSDGLREKQTDFEARWRGAIH